MISTDKIKAINDLDLEPIKVKLMHRESGEGWTLDKANAVEAEYRRFLILMKLYPSAAASPQFDVDIFWHYHILDTLKYAIDCQTIYGYFLHHFPYLGLRGEDDETAHQQHGEQMKRLYETTFGQDYGSAAAAWSMSPPAVHGTDVVASAWSMSPPAGGGDVVTSAWSMSPPQTAAADAVQGAWSMSPPSDGADLRRPRLSLVA
jgi:hypothetical protein